MSPFMGGGFGSGLRPQFEVVLAVLAARALQRSVRVVLTRPQMYALGYRPGDDPAHRARRQRRRNARRDHARCGHRDVAIRGLLSAGDRLVRPALQMRQCEIRAPARAARSCRPRATCARRARATGVFALESAMDELAVALKLDPARTSLAVLFRPRSARGPALQQQGAARMLPPGRRGVRLGASAIPEPRSMRDGERSGRLGHGDGRVGSVADADHGAHRR